MAIKKIKLPDGTVQDITCAVDSSMSTMSTNPVQNKVVKEAIDEKPGIEVASGTEYVIEGTTYTAGTNSEIFNDYTDNAVSGDYAHAEGRYTRALGNYNHAEGSYTQAKGDSSHAEGSYTTSSSSASHAEGFATRATGAASHAEGWYTQANGNYSHAEGEYTQVNYKNQHVMGSYNVVDLQNKYAFIIGNGNSTARSNALAIDWDGKLYVNNSTEGVDVGSTQKILKDIIPEGVVNRFQLAANVDQQAYQMELVQTGASSFHISGTASGTWDKVVGTITLPPGTWTMNSTISGGQDNFYFYAQGTSPVWRTNSPTTSKANTIKIITETTFTIYLKVASGYTADTDVTFAIGLAEKFGLIASEALVDHALTNSELTDVAEGLVDKGAKNLSSVDSIVYTGDSAGWKTADLSSDIASGTYKLSFDVERPSGSVANIQFWCTYTDNTTEMIVTNTQETAVVRTITFSKDVKRLSTYCASTATVKNIMICTTADWDASHDYVPFALDNPTLTPALIRQVDTGAKNLACINDATSALNLVDIPVSLKPGNYVLSVGSISTTSSDTSIRIGLYKTPNNLLYSSIDVGSNKTATFTLTSDADVLRIFPTSGAGASTGESVTFANLMLCKQEDYDVSNIYQPYALDNQILTADSSSLVDRGAKNLAWPIGTTFSANNASFTAYADGSFGIKTTAATSAVTFYYCSRVTVKPGTYVLSGGISSVVKLYDGDTWSSEGSPSIKTFTEETTFRLYIRVNNGYNNQNEVIVKPMVCTLEDFKLSSDYKAFSLNNPELTQLDAYLTDRGAKNLANYELWRDNVSVNRGTKSIASNGAITITATGNDCYTDQTFSSSALLPCRIPVTPGQTYIATWTSTNTGSGNKYFYMFPNGSSTGAVFAKASDLMCLFTAPAGCTYLTWRIGCSTSGDTVSYNNFMICTLEAWKASSAYQPYGMSNAEITERLNLKKVSATVSNTTTLTDAGITLDIPSNTGIWEVYGMIQMAGAAPTEIQLTTTQDSATSKYLVARTTFETGVGLSNQLFLTTRTVMDSTSHTYHIKAWAKMASTATGSPTVTIIARKLDS